MNTDKQTIAKTVAQDTIINLVKLTGALCAMAFCFGGPSTRTWMIGFALGLFGLFGSLGSGHADSVSSDAPPPLRLLGHSCSLEYTYEVWEGEVRNVSDERLDSVMAVVRFQDEAGTFVTSESAMIEYQPLMPGQTSPFKVATTNNPRIRHFTIGSKQMFGGELKASR